MGQHNKKTGWLLSFRHNLCPKEQNSKKRNKFFKFFTLPVFSELSHAAYCIFPFTKMIEI